MVSAGRAIGCSGDESDQASLWLIVLGDAGSQECDCPVGKVGGAIEPWWLVCILESVFTSSQASCWLSSGFSLLGVSVSLEHQSLTENRIWQM